jgi:hypothetical protein
MNTMVVLNDLNQVPSGPSFQLKVQFKEVNDFENSLLSNESIKIIT